MSVLIAEVAEEHIASAPSPAAARRREPRTFTPSSFPSFAALLRHRVPAHFQTLQGVKFVLRRGMSDPQAGKAWRRASQTRLPLGRGVDSATRLGKRATFRASHFSTPAAVLRQTDRRKNGCRKLNPPCTRMYTHPFFEATPPGAAPGPPVKNRGPCSPLPGV